MLLRDYVLVERYQQDIRICKENGIPMIVMHLTGKTECPGYHEIGLKRLQEIADYAKALDIKVAFENTVFQGYLDYVGLGDFYKKAYEKGEKLREMFA